MGVSYKKEVDEWASKLQEEYDLKYWFKYGNELIEQYHNKNTRRAIDILKEAEAIALVGAMFIYLQDVDALSKKIGTRAICTSIIETYLRTGNLSPKQASVFVNALMTDEYPKGVKPLYVQLESIKNNVNCMTGELMCS